MAYIAKEHLVLCLIVMYSQSVMSKRCAFIGSEEPNSFYLDGDIVLGGLFPLHYHAESFVQSFIKKPIPSGYKL